MRPESGFRWLRIGHKFADIFLTLFFSLVKFSYYSKFHVNKITGSGVMIIFFYKGLTKNPKIGNTII